MTYLAFNFCDLSWWHVALSWLLPFLLGLLAGWAIWARFKKQAENLEREVADLNDRITELEADLDACRHSKTDLDSQIALLKGQLREKNFELSTLESSLAAAKKAGDGSSTGKAASIAAASLAGAAKKKKDSKKDKSSEEKESSKKDKASNKDKGSDKGESKQGAGAKSQKSGDDLKKIEGVGPKIAGLLNDAGINSFAELADAKQSKLRNILDEAGPRYKIANSSTWPEQAALARDGKWDALEKLQDSIDGGVKSSGAASGQKDDLKKVEGIGPKIEGLLNDDGIMSFAQLASASTSKLKAILDAAGSRYKIANPTTWPEQAALARDGKWDDLQKLQDSLKGGKKA